MTKRPVSVASFRVRLRTAVYPLEAVLQACYALLDKGVFYLDADEPLAVITVEAAPFPGGMTAAELKEQLLGELLQASLRYFVSRKNKTFRETIVKRALWSAAGPAAFLPDSPKAGYKDDPLGIRKLWEDRYGKKGRKSSAAETA